jgi:hypothetical protein
MQSIQILGLWFFYFAIKHRGKMSSSFSKHNVFNHWSAFILISLITNYVFWIAAWLIVTNLKIDTRAFTCKVTHLIIESKWRTINTKRSLLELYWSSGKGLNTNKHVNGFLLKYSIAQSVSKCLIRLSPHAVSTSICMNKINQLVQRCIGFFFSFFFLSVLE